MPKTTRQKRAADPRAENDKTKSEADWMKLPKEALQLRCEALHLLANGTRRDLAGRLYDHHHPPQLPPPPPPVDIGDDAHDDEEGNDTIPYGNETGNENDQGDGTVSSGDGTGSTNTTTTTTPGVSILTENRMLEMIQQVVENSVKEVHSHVRALHSQVAHLQQGRRTSSPSPVVVPPVPTVSTPVLTPTCTSPSSIPRLRPVTTTAADTLTGTGMVNSVFGSLGFPSATQVAAPSLRSQYPLPAIDKKMADAIEKGDYVDFDKLMRRKLGDKSKEERRKGVQCHLKTGVMDGDETTLLLKKAKVDTVGNFTEWMAVWNLFMQARLHFRPGEAYELFRYQTHITSFAAKHKWDAVYAYDIDFRHHISLERSLPKAERSWHWEVKSTELMNEDLHNSFLSPKLGVECYSCGQEGHMSLNCPQKSAKSRSRRGAGGYGQQHHHAQQPVYPPPQQSFQHSGRPTYAVASAPQFSPAVPTFPAPRAQQSHQAKVGSTGGQYCNNWNATGDCPRGFRCRYKHECNKCGQKPDHGGIFCDRVSSSNFLPPTSR